MASAAGSRVRANPGTYTLHQNHERHPEQASHDDADAEEYDDHEEYDSEDDDDSTTSGPIGTFPFLERSRLPEYKVAKRPLKQLKLLAESQYMDLSPHYQRNVVWRRPNMIKLIDSLWKRYYVPPVIFNIQVTQFEGEDKPCFVRTCVDGKQRLTSIAKFMAGVFPIKINGRAWWFTDNKSNSRGKGKNVLPDEAKAEFESLELLCMEYKELSQSKEIELFQRVQEGKPLTAAESLKATVGPWQEFARLFEEDYADVMGLARQNDRASTFKMVLSCFSQIFECLSPTPSSGIPSLKTGTKNVEQLTRMDLDERSKERCRFIFDLFLVIQEQDPSIFAEQAVTRVLSFSPLELVAVCCLLSKWGKDRSTVMLGGDILLLRKKLREAYHDLRLNGGCWKTCWDYIDNLERFRGITDHSTTGKPRFDATKPKRNPGRKAPASAPNPIDPTSGIPKAPRQTINAIQIAPSQTGSLNAPAQPLTSDISETIQPAFTSVNGSISSQAAPPLQADPRSSMPASQSPHKMAPPETPHPYRRHVMPNSQEGRSSRILSTEDVDAQRQIMLAQFEASNAVRGPRDQSIPTVTHMFAPAPASKPVNGQQPGPAISEPHSRKRGGSYLEGDSRVPTRIKQESQ